MFNPEGRDADMNDFDKQICRFVGDYWDKYKKALRLSTLGFGLRNQFDLQRETKGARLSDYIRFGLQDSVRLIQNPADKLTWAVVPAEIEIPKKTEEQAVLLDFTTIVQGVVEVKSMASSLIAMDNNEPIGPEIRT